MRGDVGCVVCVGVMWSFQHLLNHCLVCEIVAIHFISLRFLACWCFSSPWYGVQLQCSGCVVPSLYICLKMLVIFWVVVLGRAFSSSGASSFGPRALPDLICALARVEL